MNQRPHPLSLLFFLSFFFSLSLTLYHKRIGAVFEILAHHVIDIINCGFAIEAADLGLVGGLVPHPAADPDCKKKNGYVAKHQSGSNQINININPIFFSHLLQHFLRFRNHQGIAICRCTRCRRCRSSSSSSSSARIGKSTASGSFDSWFGPWCGG